ncbi:MAG: ribonuclease Z [Flavobacteriales bacterium]
MPFELSILGCNSAVPTNQRKPTAQLLNVAGRFFLIDCGEGTQLQLRKYKIRMQNIQHVFISHLHGDHYFGLIGFISTMHLLGRKKELHVYGPPQLKEIIYVQLGASKTELCYPLFFHEFGFDSPEFLMENNDLTVHTIPLDHSLPCCGFLFKEKIKPRRMKKEKIQEYSIPAEKIQEIKEGGDFLTNDGELISHFDLTRPSYKPRSFAFCSDTRYFEQIIPQINGVDILYHEATFMHELVERAHQTMHSTTKEAATIALKANVGRLIIGHYSQRYFELSSLLNEAQSIFEDTLLAIEGEKHEVIRSYDSDS